jgi:3-methylcrotonyl-CoA carboxylase alpha subunit
VFSKILIANRGEIACRVIGTARRMGMRTVAVCSDADAGARHVGLADEAMRIGPAPANESYLNAVAIVAAARQCGAEAIHPGYGFLSENEHFAAACQTAGLVFVGPSAQAIAAMGDKSAAKTLMEKAGLPLVPGYHGQSQDDALLKKEAARVGYPVLIKPSAGGGGKGMRIVENEGQFLGALQAARREAAAAFGDERVLLERYLQRPRHIEVQVFGDSHGDVVHLFERDCSVQRRHQKVLEEAPAPGMTPERRARLCEAAVRAAKAIQYSGAGTVEFIAEGSGAFYFMEMNTRLQVEHPVTEMITGIDLVEWQLRIAAGERLPCTQEDLRFAGHAIEARIYAEDPARDFLPATGRIVHLGFPQESADVRVDAGVAQGGEISAWYDPMIAKLIARGRDRAEALARLRQALADVRIAGLTTNVAFLQRLAACRAFSGAELDTGLIERNAAELLAPEKPADARMLATAAAAELVDEQRAARQSAQASGDRYSPWHEADGWRLNEDSHHDLVFLEAGVEHKVRIRFLESGLRLRIGDEEHAFHVQSEGDALHVRLGGALFSAHAVREASDWHVFCDGEHRRIGLKRPLGEPDADTSAGSLSAPMPGRVVRVLTRPGAKVAKGEPLVILEAMKMEHTITAPADGTVKEVHFADGEQVLEGAQLITLA